MTRPAVSGGMAKMISTEVQSIVQAKNGILRRVMPGARIARMVAMKLTPAVERADAADDQAQGPEVGGGGAGEGVLGQRRVGEPADGRGAAGREAEIDEQAAEAASPRSPGR